MSDPSLPAQPRLLIEAARTSRARCKACGQPIEKGGLRLGTLVAGTYGEAYVWEHLTCAASRGFEKVAAAYADEAWRHASEPPGELPALEDLRALDRAPRAEPGEHPPLPYAEVAPDARTRCKHCGERIPAGSLRVVLEHWIPFGDGRRRVVLNVLPEHVRELLEASGAPDPRGFEAALRDHSAGLSSERLEELERRLRQVPGVPHP